MTFFDYADLDRKVAAMAESLRRRARGHARGAPSEEEEVAFAKAASERATWVALGELGADPLTAALRAWVGALTIERVTSKDVVRAGRAREEATAVDEATGAEGPSVRALVRDLIGPEREARAAASRLPSSGRACVEALRRYAERRAEAVRLLHGGTTPTPTASTDWPSLVLDRTQAAFDASPSKAGWLDVLRAGIADDAGEGWPAKISPRWLADPFGRGELFRGVRLPDLRLPEPIGAASFARALSQVGDAWAWADRPAGTPFSLFRTPADPLVARRAALLGSVLLEPAFHERALGLGRVRAKAQATAVARAALVWLRLAALRALAWPLLLAPAGPRDFEELSERALGRPMPGLLLGVLPRLDPGAGAALEAMLDALVERERLRDRFDEDWFENPRAHEALRHEHRIVVTDRAAIPVSLEARDRPGALDRRIVELLGG